MTKTKKTASMKTYILELQNGNTRRVEVPDTRTLTFGPTIPYAGKGAPSVGGTALRFYEGSGKTALRAVFTDVKAFRDADIGIMEKRTETQRKVVQKEGPGGSRDVVVEARVTEWVNPDDESNDSGQKAAAPFLLAMQTES